MAANIYINCAPLATDKENFGVKPAFCLENLKRFGTHSSKLFRVLLFSFQGDSIRSISKPSDEAHRCIT